MGMAASQARFLQLTARKTNIEYMGQQINQQRLALANQSAGLFEKMLTLEPPVPPSSLDDKYYTQGYTFNDLPAAETTNNTDVFRGDGVNKKISWAKFSGDEGSPASTDVAFSITDADTPVNTFNVTYALLADLVDTEGEVSDGTGAGGANYNGVQIDDDLETFANAMGIVPQDDADRVVMRFVTVEHSIYDPDGNYQVVQDQVPAILEFDNLNRLINMTVVGDMTTTDAQDVGANNPTDGADIASLGGLTHPNNSTIGQGEDLTYSGVFDEDTYNDDMNQYEFQKAAYDYQIERINLETAQIQKQDKSLELKMKQLDTEHKAIQTEMDAVQKVIQKNIESTFKTFG